MNKLELIALGSILGGAISAPLGLLITEKPFPSPEVRRINEINKGLHYVAPYMRYTLDKELEILYANPTISKDKQVYEERKKKSENITNKILVYSFGAMLSGLGFLALNGMRKKR